MKVCHFSTAVCRRTFLQCQALRGISGISPRIEVATMESLQARLQESPGIRWKIMEHHDEYNVKIMEDRADI